MFKALTKKGGPGKFTLDVMVNVLSYAIVGVILLFINYLILRKYNAAWLGYFNIMWAIYTLLSQLTVAGVHLSVQRFVPEHAENKKQNDMILTGAILATFVIAGVVILICYLFKGLPAFIYREPAMVDGFI